MLEQIGLFDDDFFLYCEDTDLGLRARWAGWRCRYVPEAQVEHRYSHSAGRVSVVEGVLRGAQPAVRRSEEFSAVAAVAGAVRGGGRYFWHGGWRAQARESAGRYTEGGAGRWGGSS